MIRWLVRTLDKLFPQKETKPINPVDYDYQASVAWPKEWFKGFIKTKNKTGIMVTDLGPAEKQFVELAKTAKKPLLDIGAAYGVATRPALVNGARIIACDVCDEHLSILKESVPKEWHHRLRTTTDRFPNQLNFTPESLSGILAAQLFHFLTPEEFQTGLSQCFEWLESGGHLWITTATPFFPAYQPILPEYEKRAREGDPWPGQINPLDYAKDDWLNLLPNYMQIFKKEDLERAVTAAGFTITESQYFMYGYFSRWVEDYNGKEFLMVHAVKPAISDEHELKQTVKNRLNDNKKTIKVNLDDL